MSISPARRRPVTLLSMRWMIMLAVAACDITKETPVDGSVDAAVLEAFARTDLPTVWTPCSIAAGDFNGDGVPDLAVASCADDLSSQFGKVAIHLGIGDGTFAKGAVFETKAIPNGPRSLAIGDFNGDGKLDVAVNHFGSVQPHSLKGDGHSIKLLFGNGDGTLRASIDVPTCSSPSVLAVADLDRDGRTDLVVGNQLDPAVHVLLAQPDGTFVTRDAALDGAPISLAIADLDHDGQLDLAVAGDQSIALIGQTRAALPAMGRIAIGDFNRDGWLDLVGGSSIQLGHGANVFERIAAATTSPSTDLGIGDFDGDGNLDAVMLGDGALTLRLGDGHGAFVTRSAPASGSSLSVGDFNRDGKLDLAITNADNTISVLINSR